MATDNCNFFFFVAFTLVAESMAFAADAVVVELSFAVLSELPVPLQAIMPKIMDMITLTCMSLLVVFCFIFVFMLNSHSIGCNNFILVVHHIEWILPIQYGLSLLTKVL